jgi:hypothetical protein
LYWRTIHPTQCNLNTPPNLALKKEIVMSLQAKLDAFKADFKGGKAPYFAPPEIHPIMERATAELVASGRRAM